MGRMSFANFSWFGDGRQSPAPESDAYLSTPPLSPSLPPPVLTKPATPLYTQPGGADAVVPTTFTASGLLKELPNRRILFNGIDFSLNLVPEASPHGRPDVLVIRGNSGAGKTTFLRCLAQLDSFTEGTLLLGDRCDLRGRRALAWPALWAYASVEHLRLGCCAAGRPRTWATPSGGPGCCTCRRSRPRCPARRTSLCTQSAGTLYRSAGS